MRLSFCLFLLFPGLLSAQLNSGSIEFLLGPSYSHGQLSMAAKSGGYATNGWQYTMFTNYMNDKSGLGLSISIGLGELNLNQSALKRDIQASGTDITFNDESVWTTGQMMVGGIYRIKKNKFFADGRLLAGVFFGDAPFVYAHDPSKLQKEQHLFQNETDDCFMSPGAMLMLNAGYLVSKKISIQLTANTIASQASILVKRKERGGEIPAAAYKDKFPLTCALTQIQLGVGYNW